MFHCNRVSCIEASAAHLEHTPLDTHAAAVLGHLAEVAEQALAEAAAAVVGRDVQVLELERVSLASCGA